MGFDIMGACSYNCGLLSGIEDLSISGALFHMLLDSRLETGANLSTNDSTPY